MKRAFDLAEEVYELSYLIRENLGAYNPGISKPGAEKISLSSINMDAAIVCSKLEYLRSLLWEGESTGGES